MIVVIKLKNNKDKYGEKNYLKQHLNLCVMEIMLLLRPKFSMELIKKQNH